MLPKIYYFSLEVYDVFMFKHQKHKNLSTNRIIEFHLQEYMDSFLFIYIFLTVHFLIPMYVLIYDHTQLLFLVSYGNWNLFLKKERANGEEKWTGYCLLLTIWLS